MTTKQGFLLRSVEISISLDGKPVDYLRQTGRTCLTVLTFQRVRGCVVRSREPLCVGKRHAASNKTMGRSESLGGLHCSKGMFPCWRFESWASSLTFGNRFADSSFITRIRPLLWHFSSSTSIGLRPCPKAGGLETIHSNSGPGSLGSEFWVEPGLLWRLLICLQISHVRGTPRAFIGCWSAAGGDPSSILTN